nr:MAG TPA: hypothetical protein [Caudoviricetes sp.]
MSSIMRALFRFVFQAIKFNLLSTSWSGKSPFRNKTKTINRLKRLE